MGFRKGSYAKVWSIEPKTDRYTKIRISTSKKDETGEYVTDFSGFVACVGTVTAAKAANLKENDRIKLGDVDVTTKYVKEKNTTYTNYTCFNFEMADPRGQTYQNVDSITEKAQAEVDDGESPEDQLPF